MRRLHTSYSFPALLALLALPFFPHAHAAEPAQRAAAASNSGTAATLPQSAERATWTQKEVNILYLGSTTYYSCYYLNDYVRHVLLELGARKQGLKVHPVDCGGPRPSVSGTLFVLEPISPAQTPGSDSSAVTVAAHWASVRVSFIDPAEGVVDAMTQCQLAHTVTDRVLPLFAARNARFEPDCTVYKNLTNAPVLRAEVLEAGAGDERAPENASR